MFKFNILSIYDEKKDICNFKRGEGFLNCIESSIMPDAKKHWDFGTKSHCGLPCSLGSQQPWDFWYSLPVEPPGGSQELEPGTSGLPGTWILHWEREKSSQSGDWNSSCHWISDTFLMTGFHSCVIVSADIWSAVAYSEVRFC